MSMGLVMKAVLLVWETHQLVLKPAIWRAGGLNRSVCLSCLSMRLWSPHCNTRIERLLISAVPCLPIQVANTPETLRKPSHPPPRPPPDYLSVESPPAPLPVHLNQAARNSPETRAQVERKESTRRPPPSRPMPPAPNCLLSQVSEFSASLGWGHCP